MRSRPIPVALATLVASGVLGCGADHADVPPELLAAIRAQGTQAGYPPGPYGTAVGDVVADLCFEGWDQPSAASYDPASTRRLCLSDFHADTEARLLLVESCAVWCEACRFEYQGSGSRPSLADQLAARRAQGFRLLGTIFQGFNGDAATTADAVRWAKTFDLSFPFALDDTHQLGTFTTSVVAPFNVLIDTRTMQVVLAIEGDEPAVLFGAADAFLAEPAP